MMTVHVVGGERARRPFFFSKFLMLGELLTSRGTKKRFNIKQIIHR